jgi:transposase
LGPWWQAAQIFIRWARAGVWERVLERVQERGVALGMAFLDGSNVRAHQKAAGAAKRGDLRPSEMIVKRLAALVAAMAPRPA